jgi:hypothetical protein
MPGHKHHIVPRLKQGFMPPKKLSEESLYAVPDHCFPYPLRNRKSKTGVGSGRW